MPEIFKSADFWKSLSSILWPICTLVIFFASKKLIGSLFLKEQITIEVAGMKLNIADAAKNIGKDLADLQQKVALLEQVKSRDPSIDRKSDDAASLNNNPLSVIWVDDYPSNNAFIVDRLQKDGINVELSLCTSDALSKVKTRSYDAVISDLGRQEDGQNKPMAGLDLIKSLRAEGSKLPILIFAGTRGLENKSLLIKTGATGVTTSGTEVIKFVKDIQRQQLSRN